MEKIRATAVMRELFLRKLMLKWIDEETAKVTDIWQSGVFQPLRDRLQAELVEYKRTLQSNAVFIMTEEWTEMDVNVKFKENGQIKDRQFFMPPLIAEAEGRIEQGYIFDQPKSPTI